MTGSAEDVRFDSGGYAIAGTLTAVAEPVAAALVITGSGKLNRDSDARLGRTRVMLLRTGVTRQVADALTAAGVITLRYDKRGVGASGGDYVRAGMTDNLEDARAGLRWLAERAPGLPLITVGHSEGTYHAARLAAAEGNVAGTILLSAPARTGEQVIEWQLDKLAPTLPAVAKAIFRLTSGDFKRSQHKRLDRLRASEGDVIRMQGIRVNARWYREFLAYDPAPYLRRVTAAVLAITGGHDMQVPPEDVETIGSLVGGPFEGHVAGDLSHLLRPDPGWAGPRRYRRAVRQPVSPEVLAIITGWVANRWGGRSAGAGGEPVVESPLRRGHPPRRLPPC
jgi:pimeloyl-ACP methyl ester carboxylesterase